MKHTVILLVLLLPLIQPGSGQVSDIHFIPMSALHGDNVVESSEDLDWYDGPTFLHHIESLNPQKSNQIVSGVDLHMTIWLEGLKSIDEVSIVAGMSNRVRDNENTRRLQDASGVRKDRVEIGEVVQRIATGDTVEAGSGMCDPTAVGSKKLDVAIGLLQGRGPVSRDRPVGDVDADHLCLWLMPGNREGDGSIAGGKIQICASRPWIEKRDQTAYLLVVVVNAGIVGGEQLLIEALPGGFDRAINPGGHNQARLSDLRPGRYDRHAKRSSRQS